MSPLRTASLQLIIVVIVVVATQEKGVRKELEELQDEGARNSGEVQEEPWYLEELEEGEPVTVGSSGMVVTMLNRATKRYPQICPVYTPVLFSDGVATISWMIVICSLLVCPCPGSV